MPRAVLPYGGLCARRARGHPPAGQASEPDGARFRKRHIVEITKKGEKRIKEGFKTCQFLTADRLCGVYEARPSDCRGYVCWNQEDETVYDYAAFLQEPIGKLRDREKDIKK